MAKKFKVEYMGARGVTTATVEAEDFETSRASGQIRMMACLRNQHGNLIAAFSDTISVRQEDADG